MHRQWDDFFVLTAADGGLMAYGVPALSARPLIARKQPGPHGGSSYPMTAEGRQPWRLHWWQLRFP